MSHPNLDRLLNAVLPVAKGSIEKKKEFFPFAAFINEKDEVIMSTAQIDEEEQTAEQAIAIIEEGIQQEIKDKKTTAIAFCADVQMTVEGMLDKVSAIKVSLEEISGDSYAILLPYLISDVGEVTYGDLYGEEKEKSYFV